MTSAGSSRRGWLAAALGAIAIAVLLPLASFLMAAWLLGWQLLHVQSGSMSPTYPVGSLLVTAQIDAADVEPGMPIVFANPMKPSQLVTHRVISIAPGETLQFVTQGDANATPDVAPVPARFVRARVLWHVSHLGALVDLLQWPRSFVVLVVAPGLLLLLLEIRHRRTRPPLGTTLPVGAS